MNQNQVMDRIAVTAVPTLSRRKRSVTRCLNDLLREKPEMTNTIYALVTYSTQRWARDARAKSGLNDQKPEVLQDLFRNASVLMDIIHERTDLRIRLGNTRQDSLQGSDEILDTIAEAVEWLSKTPAIGKQLSHAIKAIHFMDEKEGDLSPGDFKKYYSSALLYLHDCYGETINRQVRHLTRSNSLYQGDFCTEAYHNTMLLIRIYGLLTHRYQNRSNYEGRTEWSMQKDMDGLTLLRSFEEAMTALRSYQADGEIMYQIIRNMTLGKTDTETKAQFSLSNRSFAEKRTRAVNLISFVLWGYSTLEIVEGMTVPSLTKKDIQRLGKMSEQEIVYDNPAFT